MPNVEDIWASASKNEDVQGLCIGANRETSMILGRAKKDFLRKWTLNWELKDE